MPLNGPVTCILGPAIHFSASCRWVIKSVAIKMEHWLGKTYSHNWGVLWSWKEPAPIRLAGGGFGSLPTQFFLPNPQGVRKFKTSWGGKNKKKWQSHDCLVFWDAFWYISESSDRYRLAKLKPWKLWGHIIYDILAKLFYLFGGCIHPGDHWVE